MDVIPAWADSRFPATNVCYRNPFRVLPCEWGGIRCQLFTAWVASEFQRRSTYMGYIFLLGASFKFQESRMVRLRWPERLSESSPTLTVEKAMSPIPEVKGVSFGLHLGWTGWFQVVSFPKIAGNQCSLGQQRRVFGGALEAFGDRQWSRLEFLGLFPLGDVGSLLALEVTYWKNILAAGETAKNWEESLGAHMYTKIAYACHRRYFCLGTHTYI